MSPKPDKYRLMIETLADAFAYNQIITDDKGVPVDYIFVEINDAFELLVGLKKPEVIGKRVTEVQPDIKNSTFDWIGICGRVALTGEPIRFETLSEPLGRWYDVSAYSDSPGYFGVIFRDITDRRQLEEALVEKGLMLETILNTVPQSIFWKDRQGRYLGCNQVFADHFGLACPKEIIGKTDYEIAMDKSDAESYRQDDKEVLENVTPKLHIIEQLQQSAGGRLWVDTSKVPLHDKNGEPFAVLGIYEDITARKEAEEALLKSEREFRATFELASVGIVQVNPQNGAIIRYNIKFREITGYSDEELMETSFPALTHPDDRQKDWEIFSRAAGGETPSYQNEKRYICKDGSVIWVRLNAAFIRDDDGKPMRTIAVCEDITEQKKALKLLELQARERAAVDAFTNSVSHDLQAPLRRIEGFSELLLEDYHGYLDEKGRDYLNRISTQVGAMKVLTDALLLLSKIVSQVIRPEKVDISALTRSYLHKLHYSELDREADIIIAPDLVTEGDMDLINVALENLLSNAWKFTSAKNKTRIEIGSYIRDGCRIFFVKDNGAGFDMENYDKLFLPFHKLHDEEKYPGVGIGLNIAYRIITRHGGELWAEGESGKGACFYFTLPSAPGK